MSKAKARTANSPNGTTVYLVDDCPLIRFGWTRLLSREAGFDVVGEAGGVADAIRGIEHAHPDLVICDYALTEGSTLDLIKHVLHSRPETRVLVSSSRAETTHAERAFHAGATGFITKRCVPADLLEAARQVVRGRIVISPDLSDQLMHRALHSRQGLRANPVEDLSDREMQVFELLGDGLATRQIADRLCLSVKTIETYRDHIKHKLALASSAQLIYQAVRWKVERDLGSHI